MVVELFVKRRSLLITALLMLLIFISCDNDDAVNSKGSDAFPVRGEFEAMTKIVLPKEVKVISNPSVKTGEHIKRTILALGKNDCQKFQTLYRFRPVNDTLSPLFESVLLDSVYKLIPPVERQNYLHRYGRRYSDPEEFRDGVEKNKKWLYLLDTSSNRLYCIISYPNLLGYAR